MNSVVFPLYRVLRALLVLSGLAVFTLVFVYFAREEYRDASEAYLVGGGVLLAALWTWWGPWLLWYLGLAAAAGGLALADRPLSAAVTLAALVASVLPHIVLHRRYLRSFRDSELELTGPEEPVPEVDREAVALLEAAGFHRLGTQRWRLGEWASETTLLLGRARDRIAEVSEGDADLTSRFGERRLVTTTRQAEWGSGPLDLSQRLAYVGPEVVQATHQRALDVLAARGLRPDTFATDEDAIAYLRGIIDEFIEGVSAAPLRQAFRNPFKGSAVHDHLLADDERSRRRIDAWLETRT